MIERLKAGVKAGVKAGLRSGFALAVLVSVLLVGFAASRTRTPTMDDFDQPFYIGMAHDLLTTGRFTDGFMHGSAGADGTRPSGKMFQPLYPTLLAAMATFSPAMQAGFTCIVRTGGKSKNCGDPLRGVRLLQFGMLAAVFAMIWLIAREAGAPAAAVTHLKLPDDQRATLFPWLALAAAGFAVQRLANTFVFAMTESLTLFFCTAAALCGVMAYRRISGPAAAACGALVAAAALTRPGYLYLFVVMTFCVCAAAALQTERRRWLLVCAAFVVAALALLAPWMVRNALTASAGGVDYRAHTLAQRVTYNTMSLTEWARSFVCFGSGSGLTDILFGKGACLIFSWWAPDSFYMRGQAYMNEVFLAAGGWDKAFSYLMREKILAQPVWHGAVTLTMALAGAWIANWCGVVFGLTAMWLTWFAVARRHVGFLLVALPGWFMLLFQGAVAVNQDRYNFYLIVPYALAGGWLMLSVYERLRPVQRGTN